ncbi:MAG: TatD family hydrolase [Bacteroidales bacterium]|nr:TatD family hydrolase [Bacteroidales bacterium]
MTMYLVDTHTHIYDHQFDLDRTAAMQRALEAGVGMMLLPNVDVSTIAPMLDLHEKYPDCTQVMMGLQPEEVKEDYKTVLDKMEKELSRGIYIGVGEVGLDFYWDSSYEQQQLDAFETQLDWAKQLGLPLSIHCRNAFEKMARILEKKQDGGLRGVMHCFTGTEEEATVYLELGFHLGLGGVTTYKNCGVKDYLPKLPLERIVLETDAPYLSPVPYRGKRNEPAFLIATAQKIADMLGITLEEVANATSSNALSLFHITEQLNN